MREILFRGKTTDGEWVYGSFIKGAEKRPDLCVIKDDTFLRTSHLCLTDTVGQYTGLTDKNGTKIFEGDILECSIYYDIGCYPHSEKETIVVEIPNIYKTKIDSIYEVIGNIYDNPELINGN